jgi:hypothetical protein
VRRDVEASIELAERHHDLAMGFIELAERHHDLAMGFHLTGERCL